MGAGSLQIEWGRLGGAFGGTGLTGVVYQRQKNNKGEGSVKSLCAWVSQEKRGIKDLNKAARIERKEQALREP